MPPDPPSRPGSTVRSISARGVALHFYGLPPAIKAAAFMLASTMLISVMHAVIRHVSATQHSFEIAFFRSFFGLLVFLPFMLRRGFATLSTRRLPLHLARGVLQTGAMLMFFTALSLLPLAQVSALSFTSPLFTSVFAVILLGERVSLRRTAALIVGLAGALIIIRPGAVTVELGSLLVLGSSALWAVGLIIVKTLSRTDSSITIVTYMNLLLTPLTLTPALFVWRWPTAPEYFWLLFIGAVASAAHYAMAQAMRHADATAVMPYDFSRLIWTSLFGFVFFAEIPSLWTLAGGVVIFASTTYITYREARIGGGEGATRAP